MVQKVNVKQFGKNIDACCYGQVILTWPQISAWMVMQHNDPYRIGENRRLENIDLIKQCCPDFTDGNDCVSYRLVQVIQIE